jgi:catechol 2,3-dioxygenase-like lactoylglutathione lyase family enzyme
MSVFATCNNQNEKKNKNKHAKPATVDGGRRALLRSLPAAGIVAAFSPWLQAQDSTSGIRLLKLHCFELRVADVARTVAFYQDLFGMPVQSTFGGRTCLKIGDSNQFMAVRAMLPGETPAITTLGYSVADYDISTQLAALKQLGFDEIPAPPVSDAGLVHAMKAWVMDRAGTPELYFADARGVIAQLSDESYCGGSGPLGAVCEALQPAEPGLFRLSEINHFTAFVNDGAGANQFYQESFGLEVQAYQGPNSPVTGIGDGYQFVMYAGPFPGGENAPASINHGSLNMHGFDEKDILEKLTAYGLQDRGERPVAPLMHYVSRRMPARGGAEGGTPEVYFTDPDGILMQLQDLSYCGGGGYLGSECLRG